MGHRGYMKLYNDADLARFKEKENKSFPIHPYALFMEKFPSFIELLEKMATDLLSVENFRERVDEARENTNDPINFYTFSTEIKIAYFLKSKSNTFEILSAKANKPMPDFLADEIYVEANMPHKNFIILNHLQEELKTIDKRFRFERRHYNSIMMPNINNGETIYNEIAHILQQYWGQNLDSSPKVVWQCQLGETNKLCGILDDPCAGYQAGMNQQSDPQETISKYLKESLASKVKDLNKNTGSDQYLMKNDLNKSHPNILWSEFMFLQDFQCRNFLNEFDWNQYGLPAQLDAQIISITDIDKDIEANKPNIEKIIIDKGIEIDCDCGFPTFILINGQANTEHVTAIRDFICKVFPDNKPITLTNTAEAMELFK